MPLPVSRFLTSRISHPSTVGSRPMITEIPNSSVVNPSRIGGGVNSQFDPQRFWRKFSRSPEFIGTIQIPITDILGDRPEWVAPDGTALGRNKRLEAERFWKSNRGKETIEAWLYETFLSGDGYLWKGKATNKEIKEAVKKVIKRISSMYGKELDTKEISDLQIKYAQDEDLKGVKKFDYIASSTMRTVHDEYEILGYEQNVNGKTSWFNPEDIIHYRFMTINGRVSGFAPAEALASEFLLISLVKDNMISYMQNGGSPDKVFILPKEIAKSRNHEFLIDQLKKYKSINNWHGNLVFTGELQIEDLQGSPKDLEYKDLALFIISNMAFAYGIPSSRIPYLLGKSATGSGEGGGVSESGYWNKISKIQDSIEDLLNSQMFDEMGWNIKFPRKYKQDEVREAQTSSMNADTILKYQEILRNQGKQLTIDKSLELLGWDGEDIEDLQMETLINNPNNNQNMLPNNQLMNEPTKQAVDQKKRNSANAKGVGEALNNP